MVLHVVLGYFAHVMIWVCIKVGRDLPKTPCKKENRSNTFKNHWLGVSLIKYTPIVFISHIIYITKIISTVCD